MTSFSFVILSDSEESITDYEYIPGHDSIPEWMLHFIEHDIFFFCHSERQRRI
jgi:hypothetical protein